MHCDKYMIKYTAIPMMPYGIIHNQNFNLESMSLSLILEVLISVINKVMNKPYCANNIIFNARYKSMFKGVIKKV